MLCVDSLQAAGYVLLDNQGVTLPDADHLIQTYIGIVDPGTREALDACLLQQN